MKPVRQSILMDDVPGGWAETAIENGRLAGDCLRACVASILEFSLDDVPHFAQYRGSRFDDRLWWWALIGFCFHHGWSVDYIEGETPRGWAIAAGKSPRGHGHVVVAEDGEIRHDPHPSAAGLTAIEHFYRFQRIDPQ